MTKFYRTYITTFENSRGIKYYAGKHESTYENPSDDPYVGSGRVIRSSVKKYGKSCVLNQVWFDHDSETEMLEAEKKLIAECHSIYGTDCVNQAEGGEGGHWMKYSTDAERQERINKINDFWHNLTPEYREIHAKRVLDGFDARTDEQKEAHRQRLSIAHENKTPEEKQITSSKISAATTEQWAKMTPEERAAHCDSLSTGWANRTDEQKEDFSKKRSFIAKEIAANRSPEERETVIANTAKAARKSEVWQEPMYSILLEEWNRIGQPNGYKFDTHCKKSGITTISTRRLANHFNKIHK